MLDFLQNNLYLQHRDVKFYVLHILDINFPINSITINKLIYIFITLIELIN